MVRGCWRGGKGWVSAGSGAVCVEPCLAHFGRQPASFGNDNVIGAGQDRISATVGAGAGGPGGSVAVVVRSVAAGSVVAHW